MAARVLWSLVVLAVTSHLRTMTVHASVIHVFSVSRHGARNVLPKNATLHESEATGGPTLLPQGQRQCYDAGADFRARYLDLDNCTSMCLSDSASGDMYGLYGSPDSGFTNYNTYVQSSALDRTLMSADCFLAGAFPNTNNASATKFVPTGAQVVPVFTVAESQDWLIRGYTRCPAYEKRLQTWFTSEEFKTKESDSAGLRAAVAAADPSLNTSLANWWNVYDAYNVWRTYGVGGARPDIDNATYAEMVSLAQWLETSKMRSSLAGNLLGGALLGRLMQALDAAAGAHVNGSTYYKLLAFSSHYNTQLGLLAALGMDTWPLAAAVPWTLKIPKLSALLAFELHSVGEQMFVRGVYQDGPLAEYAVLPLPCGDDAAVQAVGPGACSYSSFLALASPAAITTTAQWCDLCDNNSTSACQLRRQSLQVATLNSAAASADNNGLAWKIAVTAVVTCVGTALITALVMWQVGKRRASKAGAYTFSDSRHDSLTQNF